MRKEGRKIVEEGEGEMEDGNVRSKGERREGEGNEQWEKTKKGAKDGGKNEGNK